MLSTDAILEGLTEPQREAVVTIDGPLLVLAGAGSGKTRTITRRVAYMASCGIPPSSIVALTFTNKAAGEMRLRTEKLLGSTARNFRSQGATVATFHSLCARLAREFCEPLGLPSGFTIFDSADQNRLIKTALKDLQIPAEKFEPPKVLSAISKAKNQLHTVQHYTQAAGAFFEKTVARVYARYEALLRENKAIDFDDLLLKIALLLRDNGRVRDELHQRYQYILIDEYQDTNQAQFLIANMLAAKYKNICATGDPDQSIYGWRGANLQNILQFEAHYPDAKIVLLEQNYRSTKVILKAASSLIANNSQRKKKDLWTENETGPKIRLLKTNDEHEEAHHVVSRLKKAHVDEKLSWDKMAIFYRMNALSRVLEDALMKANVPYQIARGTEFYARKEIKDVLAYLKVIANPADGISLERIVNVPTRGVGETALTKLTTFAGGEGISLLEACARAGEVGLIARAAANCKQLAGQFSRWRELAFGKPGAQARAPVPATRVGVDSGVSGAQADARTNAASEFHQDPLFDQSLADAMQDAEEISPEAMDAPMFNGDAADAMEAESEAAIDGGGGAAPTGAARSAYQIPGGIRGLLEIVVRESGLEQSLKKPDDADREQLANVGELINVAAEFDLQNPEGNLEDYLQQVTLISDVDKIQDAGGAVTLMTLHAAKGLEFPLVAIVGMEDGLLPHARALGYGARPDELEEERRLAFVGVTRAMRQLMLSYARYRMVRGTTQRGTPSQFIDELPPECIEEIDLSIEAEAPGSSSYRDEAGYARRAQQRSAQATQQRQQAGAMADEFARGALVRHPQFGLGRIETITAAGTMTSAVVRFQEAGRKTLILQYAKLQRVG